MTIIAPLYITQSPELETALKTENRAQSIRSCTLFLWRNQVRGTVLLQKWKPNHVFKQLLEPDNTVEAKYSTQQEVDKKKKAFNQINI